MNDSKDLVKLPEEDYQAIEAAVIDSARGRWFLDEFSRRNRHADTMMLLDAIARLETSISSPAGPAAGEDILTDPEKVKFDLVEMASAIARTKDEIAALRPESADDSQIQTATEELDAIVAATETATSDILEAAEQTQEIIWALREAGADGGQCDKVEEYITTIYTSCSFQDITGQRINKIVNVLKYLEMRLNALVKIWGGEDIVAGNASAGQSDKNASDMGDARDDAHLLNGPQLEGKGNDQTNIDDLMADIDIEPIDEDTRESEPEEDIAKDEIELPAEEPDLEETNSEADSESKDEEAKDISLLIIEKNISAQTPTEENQDELAPNIEISVYEAEDKSDQQTQTAPVSEKVAQPVPPSVAKPLDEKMDEPDASDDKLKQLDKDDKLALFK